MTARLATQYTPIVERKWEGVIGCRRAGRERLTVGRANWEPAALGTAGWEPLTVGRAGRERLTVGRAKWEPLALGKAGWEPPATRHWDVPLWDRQPDIRLFLSAAVTEAGSDSLQP